MIPFLATLFAKPILDKLPLPDTAKGKITAINNLFSGGSGDQWIALGRQQSTLPYADQARSGSGDIIHGKAVSTDKDIAWVQFEWPEMVVGHCIVHFARWRFYETGLICLEIVASKDAEGFDLSDLVGHGVELRDETGFLIGVWSAAFLIHKGAARAAFQASAVDDFLPLKLHFNQIAERQESVCFRI